MGVSVFSNQHFFTNTTGVSLQLPLYQISKQKSRKYREIRRTSRPFFITDFSTQKPPFLHSNFNSPFTPLPRLSLGKDEAWAVQGFVGVSTIFL
jgi:hypothetical protein